MKKAGTKSAKAALNFMRDPKGSDPSKDDELIIKTGWKVWKWAVFSLLILFLVLPAGCAMIFGYSANHILSNMQVR